jgi:hypothetical protein
MLKMTNGSKAELKHNFNRSENTFSEEVKAQMAVVIKARTRQVNSHMTFLNTCTVYSRI